MTITDKLETLVGSVLIGGVLVVVVWANHRLYNLVDSCAPGLVIQTPKGWICTEVISR